MRDENVIIQYPISFWTRASSHPLCIAVNVTSGDPVTWVLLRDSCQGSLNVLDFGTEPVTEVEPHEGQCVFLPSNLQKTSFQGSK